MPQRALKQDPRAVDAGRRDFGGRSQRQCRRAMHDHIDVGKRAVDRCGIANVAENRIDLLALGIVECSDVERADSYPVTQ